MTKNHDIDIKAEKEPWGWSVSVRQVTGVNWDPMFGGNTNPITLTPYEAEELMKELSAAITTARGNQAARI